MIEGVLISTQQADAATNTKSQKTYKDEFRSFLDKDSPVNNSNVLKNTPIETKSAHQEQTSKPSNESQAEASQTESSSTNDSVAGAAILSLNMMLPADTAPTLQLQTANTQANTVGASSQNLAVSTQSNTVLNTDISAPQTEAKAQQTPTGDSNKTQNGTAQNLAAIIKSPNASLSQAELNAVGQSTNTATKQQSIFQTQQTAANTNITQAIISNSDVPQGASAQFLQASKPGNMNGASGKNGSASTNTNISATSSAGTSSATANQSSASAATFTTSASTNPATAINAATTSIAPPNTMGNSDIMSALPDADVLEGIESTTKDTSLTSSNSTGAQATKTPDLPPTLRNASTVTQQAWAGLISRMDGKNHQFQIRLDPAELGRINVTIEITKDKKATVVLAAKSAEAIGELSRGSKALEAALAEAGVELEENGLKLEISSDESSSFTFSEDDDDQMTKTGEEISDESDASQEAQSEGTRQITPEITAWSRSRVDLKA